MKKLLFALSCIPLAGLNAQIGRTCGTPVLPASYETWIKSITPVPGKYHSGMTQSVFNIPVVVHVIHNNEPVNSVSATSGNNLNAAQIVDQINILNKDYNGLNADTSLIPTIFKPLLGKFQVNFCLAVVNPTGGVMAEPGIDRIDRNAKGWSAAPYSQNYIDATIKPNSIWNTNKYLNIWVCALGNGLLGYATFPNPGSSGVQGLSSPYGSASNDGVVILNTSFGSIGTAQSGAYNKGRTATHEIGHWVGLRHTWGDANCGTDYCNDTPPAQTSNFGCPSFPHNVGVCSGNTTGEMTMNYMDYTDDACMQMFTADQKFRAQLILTNSTMRAAVITSTVCNLPAVGNDVGISFVTSPTYSQSVNCINYINPIINVTNYGSTTLTSATFTYNADGVSTQSYSWTGSVAPNSSFTVALSQLTVSTAGAHQFNVGVSAPNGGSDNNLSNNISQQQFYVSYSTFPFTATPSSTICPGDTVILNASGATTYSWSTGDTTSSVKLGPQTTTAYTVTGNYGLCSQSKTVSVTVDSAPTFSINTTHVCKNQTTQLVVAGANTYTWSNGSNLAAINVSLSSPAVYTVIANSVSGCTASQVYTITVDSLPVLFLAAWHVSCGSCSDATVFASVSGAAAPYTYTWTPGNAHTSVITNGSAGCYTVTVGDAKGCMSADTVCVSFDTGIFTQPATLNIIKVQPNPSEGKFLLNFEKNGLRKIEVINALGQQIYFSEITASSQEIDIADYPDGLYYARISSDSGNSVLKLLKH